MPRFFRRRRQAPPAPVVGSAAYLNDLAKEFKVPAKDIITQIRSVGYDPERLPEDQIPLIREILSCKYRRFDRYRNPDPAYAEKLDAMLRDFDEIYVDTAPIIQEDWFVHFAVDAMPILKRRHKRLLILMKTMEELHGLKDNQEKDREVRVRATVRPDFIRYLARQGVARIGDTGSEGIADDHLVKLFGRIGRNENILLITQDRGLSERVVRQAHEQAEAGPQPIPQSFWERFTRKPVSYRDPHFTVVCKLAENGILRRCYICPVCGLSYYDDFSEADGMLPDSGCIKKQQMEAERDAAKAAKLKEEEARRTQEAARRALRDSQKTTVGRKLAQKKRKLQKAVLSIILVAVAVWAVYLILF